MCKKCELDSVGLVISIPVPEDNGCQHCGHQIEAREREMEHQGRFKDSDGVIFHQYRLLESIECPGCHAVLAYFWTLCEEPWKNVEPIS